MAIEGDSAFGFSGMEIETICRYRLPVVTVIFNNGGIYRGDGVNLSGGADPSPTTLMKEARYDKMIEAFGGVGYHAVDPPGLTKALTAALASGKPALIDCAIDPNIGTRAATSATSTRKAASHAEEVEDKAVTCTRSAVHRPASKLEGIVSHEHQNL